MKRILYSGFFDLLHLGHIRALKKARKFGYLIVHIPPDEEAKMVKGESRPIIPQSERAEMLSNLKFVDEVFAHPLYMTDEEVINATKADIIIRNKGNKDKFSCKVVYFSRSVPPSKLDTTGIIKKILLSKPQEKIVGVNFILKSGSKILLQKRDKKKGIRCPGMLAVPGGKIEKGENPHIACIRELFEETGLILHGSKFNFLMDIKYPWGDMNRVFFIKLKNPIIVSGNEGKMEWHSLNENLKLAANQNEIIYKLKKYERD